MAKNKKGNKNTNPSDCPNDNPMKKGSAKNEPEKK